MIPIPETRIIWDWLILVAKGYFSHPLVHSSILAITIKHTVLTLTIQRNQASTMTTVDIGFAPYINNYHFKMICNTSPEAIALSNQVITGKSFLAAH